MITVLGDPFFTTNETPEDNQILRCPKHKLYESTLLQSIHLNGTFIDAGAHWGDTVITMSLFARRIGRNDIRFFAFEPCKSKCDYIESITKLNNLPIKVINTALGDFEGFVKSDGFRPTELGSCAYVRSNYGSPMSMIDSFLEMIGEVGVLHVDVEGWEAKVLMGFQKGLSNVRYPMTIILECWENEISFKRRFSKTPEDDILRQMSKYPRFKRMENIIDEEKNLVFCFDGNT
jgi:FkbM family methyltransferase